MISDNQLKIKADILTNKLQAGLFEEVIRDSKILLKKRKHQFFYNILSIAYQNIGKFDLSVQIMEEALQKNSSNPYFLNNMGISQHKLENFKEAEEFFKKGLQIAPNYINILNNIANLKKDLNLIDEAIDYYKKSIKINALVIETQLNLASIYTTIGKFKDAKYHFNKVLEINPKFTEADRLISSITEYDEDDFHLKDMLNKINDKSLNKQQLIHLHFAIGKGFEDIKNYKDSFINYHKANQYMKEITKYNINQDIKDFEYIKNFFKDYQGKAINKNSKKLIFIVGMPRSGTSLVEQIISSHSSVFGAGELFILSNIVKDEFFTNLKKKLNIKSIQNTNFDDWHKKYNDQLKGFNSNESFLTDKNPLNFLWIGFIKIVFPNAKIIHCYRNPKETCLSIYKNVFPGSDLAWTYNQKELGTYYNLYEDLMKFWHKLFPNYIYDIKYEKLINNQEEQSKALITACNLKWEKNCLDFHQNKRPIKTLSITQARQKIYNTSLNLSENYKLELKELFSILSK